MRRSFRPLTVLILAVGLALSAACLVYPPEYVWRVLAWRDADADDYLRLPMRRIEPASGVAPLAREPALAAVRTAWAKAGGEPDMEAELARLGTQAFLVLRGDRILYEWYGNGATRESWVTSFSVAKSFLSVLVGIAIAEGAISSVDDPVTRYVPELQQRDRRFERITLRHLLDMSSGLHYREFPFLHGDDAKTYYHPDLRSLALHETQVERPPGEAFEYNNYNPLLLGIALERATRMPVATYLQERLWKPAGMVAAASWSLDSERDGFEKLESGINARAEDFARFGLLMLRQGRAASQVVPPDWIAETTTPRLQVPPAYYAESVLRERQGSYYNAGWWGWKRERGGHDFAARGNHGQLVLASPANDVVIVRHGWRYGLDPAEWMQRTRRMADALAVP